MSRVLCIDYGRSRVGLAVSDALGRTAQPLDVIKRPKRGSLVERLLEVARDVEAEEIVVGLPLRLDGTEGVAAEAARQFADALSERTDVPVKLWDERLSTAEASRDMRRAGVRAREQREVIDKVAAAVVLRSYLESQIDESLLPSDAVLPEDWVDGPRAAAPDRGPGGRASAKRRSSQKRQRRRRGRRSWEPDPEDL